MCVCVCMCVHTRTHASVSIYHIFLSQSSVDGPLGCFHVLAVVNSAATNVGVHVFFELEFSFFPDICSGVGLLDHMVTLFLAF